MDNAIPYAVYLLCALTSLGCSLLLLNSYRRSRVRILFWGSACFICLTLANILLFIDLALLGKEMDLAILRNSITLFGLIILIYGLIWETT